MRSVTNEYDIELARRRHARHPVLARAARILYDLKVLTDSCNDGWPYWAAPARSARRLMELLEDADPAGVTEKDLRAALAPVKAMLTKNARVFAGRTIDLG